MEAVLFVDDEINILASLRRGLMDEEYECLFASSGKEALEIMRNKVVSVIVTDMRMPEMDGLALLKEVKANYPKTIRIVLSGYTQLQQILATINQVDIFKFITKPWNLDEELKVIIRQALEYYKMQAESERLKKELDKKNQAYQNILKNIDEIISSSKKSREVLGAFGKQILVFNSKVMIDRKEDCKSILENQEKIYELFMNAVVADEMEINAEVLAEQLFEKISEYTQISKYTKELGQSQKLKVFYKVAEAILVASVLIFKNEFDDFGLEFITSMTQDNKITISLNSSFVDQAFSADRAVSMLVSDLKIEFLNFVMGSVASMLKIAYSAAKINDNLVIELTFNS